MSFTLKLFFGRTKLKVSHNNDNFTDWKNNKRKKYTFDTLIEEMHFEGLSEAKDWHLILK
jgi:hypothetical protein